MRILAKRGRSISKAFLNCGKAGIPRPVFPVNLESKQAQSDFAQSVGDFHALLG